MPGRTGPLSVVPGQSQRRRDPAARQACDARGDRGCLPHARASRVRRHGGIAFSGHGTTTHELAPHDADPHWPADTLISIADLSRWLSAVPARNLLLVLDCCFSGGVGAKAMQMDLVPRSPSPGLPAMQQIAGAGRIALSAASPDEEAYESRSGGHGFLICQSAWKRGSSAVSVRLGFGVVFTSGCLGRAACRTRLRSRSSLARPYVCRLSMKLARFDGVLVGFGGYG